MQVINTKDHSQYGCPLKFSKWNDNTKCSGPDCMWWTTILVTTTDYSTFPHSQIQVKDCTRGYCGH